MTVDRPYPVVFLAVFTLVTVGALVVAASVSGTAFNTYNPTWDGTSEMRSIAERTGTETDIVRDSRYYRAADPTNAVVFILSPDSAYTAREVAGIREFVRGGGTVVIAGDLDTLTTNRLLDELGVTSRLNGSLLRDEENFYRGPSLPRATNVTRHPYTTNVPQLTLNHATVVDVDSPNGTRLVNSSSFSYLDANRNGELDDTETLREYTVVSLERIGRGQVVTAGDPSLFINAMLDQEGNRQFVRNILSAHHRVGIDVSHTGGLPPVAWFVVTVRESLLLQFIGGSVLVLGIAHTGHIVRGVRILRKRVGSSEPDPPTVSREELIASLRQRYSEWDDRRLHRVVENLIDGDENARTDE